MSSVRKHSWLRRGLLSAVSAYQAMSQIVHTLSWCFGYPGQCRYPVSCSEYARIEISSEKSLILIAYNIGKRLLSCGPWAALWECGEKR